jgi:DNA-binding CsgD family transcriptional regulator
VLVGRRAELAVLERALGEVERGGARALGLRGEPGIGKSRLLAELAEGARQRGLLVLEGRAAELERDLPFALLAEALEPLVEGGLSQAVRGLERERLGELAAVLPVVGSLTEVEAAPASGERHRLARAVRTLLERLAVERPLALLLDDVHWADPASADVLALLLHRPPRGGVLLALAVRPGRAPEAEGALAAAQRNGTAEVVELGPLSPEAAGELVPGAGRAARERLYRESGGNPFYLQELARVGHFDAEGADRAGLLGVPRAVQAALIGELAALSDAARRVLEGAAVAGDPFEPELAAVAADVDEEVALASLDELLDADLVRATEQPRRFRFRHPLVRRAVYEEAGGGWRLAAHARAAEALEARGASPAQRAHHVERAARPADLAAVELLVAAAEEAAAAAPATAAGWYEAALRLLPDEAEHAERRLGLLGAQGQALAFAGRPVEARDVLRRVLALLPPEAAGERVKVAEALADLEALWLDDREEARRLLHAEREAVGDAAPGLAAALTFAMARERAACGDHDGAEALAEQARADARAAGDRVLEAAVAVTVADAAHCRLRSDDPAALEAVNRKIGGAGALVDALPDEQLAERLQMLVWLFTARYFTGSLPAAREAVERGLVVARRAGQGLLAPAFRACVGMCDWEMGRPDTAEEAQEEALENALVSGNTHLAFWASVVLGWIALGRGRVEAALAHGQAAWDHVGVVPYSQAGYNLADARLAAADPHGAAAALEAFGWVNPGLWTLDRLRATDVAVRVLLALGRVEQAADLARRAPAEGGGRRTGVFGAVIAHAHASVLLAQDAAAEAAGVALAGAAEGDNGLAPLWAGRCRTLAGEALAACGRGEEARAELRRAAAELEACTAWGYRDAALRVLRRLGDRPRPAASTGRATGHDRLAPLSPREREVALLVGQGHTNAQIAAQLQLSERTVEKHVSSLLAKLELSSRTGVVWLLRDEPPAR